MKIQIDGATTINKGSELMIYSILEQIENKYPASTVIINDQFTGFKLYRLKTNLNFKLPPLLLFGDYPRAILSRFKLPSLIFSRFNPRKNIDLILDASGFRLGDQWNHSNEYLQYMNYYYKTMKNRGTKIVFLPQTFGPFKTDSAKKSIEIVNSYVDLIFARETMSQKHLIEVGTNPQKILQFPDFTISTKGIFSNNYKHIKGNVCVIPNKKMITMTRFTSQDYYKKVESIISRIKQSGKEVFLLNHEEKDDLKICNEISRKFNKRIPIITGLNAKEIKGIIGASYMVISSRYHGVASSLNQGIPCLATSWSHKYQFLFEDFNLKNHIIDPVEKPEQTEKKIDFLLDPENNARLRKQLLSQIKELKKITENMWKEVWKIAEEN